MSGGGSLVLEDVSLEIGAHRILKGVNLKAPSGKIVCLLGSNGVGKTTLLRTISGVYRTALGSISFDGRRIINAAPHEIVAEGISHAPEGRHIFATLTVEQNLIVGGHQRSQEDIEDGLKSVTALFPKLRERWRQKAGTLSGGEQQMLCIGRALMSKPRVLLLDEPSLGLAPFLVRAIFDLMSSIRDAGITILIVEQNVRAALRISDYAYVMEGGRIVLEGSASDLSADQRVLEAYLGRK